jgi:hypothetical protein
MAESDATVRIREGACTIVLDTEHWPVVFATWFGEPNEAAVSRYFAKSEELFARARRARQKFVLVTDAASAERPSAKVRKLIADKTNQQPSDAPELTAGSIIVVENTLIRGVVTALTWILPRLSDSEIVSGIDIAISRALELLDGQRIARPATLGPGRYRRPAA